MVDLSERAGKAGYYGTRCALIRESRNGGKPPRPGEPDIPGWGAEILRR